MNTPAEIVRACAIHEAHRSGRLLNVELDIVLDDLNCQDGDVMVLASILTERPDPRIQVTDNRTEQGGG